MNVSVNSAGRKREFMIACLNDVLRLHMTFTLTHLLGDFHLSRYILGHDYRRMS